MEPPHRRTPRRRAAAPPAPSHLRTCAPAQLVASIVSKMDDKGITADLRRTYIQTLSAISRSGGYRLGKQLELVVPLVLQQCSPAKARGDAEMCEACLQAFDSFVLRCPKDVAVYQQEIARMALQVIRGRGQG